jgi:sulfate adenylyltransferase
MKIETNLISPYGGKLVDLRVPPAKREELIEYATRLPSIQLTARGLCDLEMLAAGAFSPLQTFMNRADFESVSEALRLADGTVFPIPVSLPVEDFDGLKLDADVALRDAKNDLLAILTVEEIYEWSPAGFAANVLGTQDFRHPLVAEIQHWGKLNIAGKLRVLNLPKHFDFQDLRLAPGEVRERLARMKNARVVAFQTRNPIHRAHEEMTRRAAEITNGTLLIHPTVGLTKAGDIDYLTRVRTYRALVKNYYDPGQTLLALIPLAMRLAGPREALWHALVRRNYGAGFFIVGRDHASPGTNSHGRPFYPPHAARELVEKFSDEIGVGCISFDEMLYLPDENRFEEKSKISKDAKSLALSGTQIREDFLYKGKVLPDWFTRRETAEILAESYPPRRRQGVCLWFTGLSGAGKSTTAEILTNLLTEHGRRVTVLDGDVVRTHLSKGLGFSKADRDTNVLRIGFVAAEIVRHGGACICAAVSPYRAARNEVRNAIGSENFIEIFVNAPLDVCEQRDTKGMYAKARRGEIKDFTGIDDVYEIPETAEITIDTVNFTVEENARSILDFLAAKGFVEIK